MASQGPLSPGTMADDTTVGTIAWANPNNAKVSDSVYSVAGLDVGPDISHYLKATNFGFAIPAGSVINGILVEIETRVNTGTMNAWTDIRIVKGGVIEAVSKAGGASLTTTSTYYPIPSTGASTDLWGGVWTVDDINASTFGVVASQTNDGAGFRIVSVDHIRITVYYSQGIVPSSSAWGLKILDF